MYCLNQFKGYIHYACCMHKKQDSIQLDPTQSSSGVPKAFECGCNKRSLSMELRKRPELPTINNCQAYFCKQAKRITDGFGKVGGVAPSYLLLQHTAGCLASGPSSSNGSAEVRHGCVWAEIEWATFQMNYQNSSIRRPSEGMLN